MSQIQDLDHNLEFGSMTLLCIPCNLVKSLLLSLKAYYSENTNLSPFRMFCPHSRAS